MKRRGSFPLTQYQRFEYIFVRSPGTTSWTTRAMILNIETGALLEYAEKSGKKILKERYNVKSCEVSAEDTDVQAFDRELSMLISLVDGKELQLAFETQESYDEWLKYFKSFSKAPVKLITKLPAPEPMVKKPVLTPTEVIHPNSTENTSAGTAATAVTSTTKRPSVDIKRGSITYSDKQKPSLQADSHRRPSGEKDRESRERSVSFVVDEPESKKASKETKVVDEKLIVEQKIVPEQKVVAQSKVIPEQQQNILEKGTQGEEHHSSVQSIPTKPKLPINIKEGVHRVEDGVHEESPMGTVSAKEISVGFYSSSVSQSKGTVSEQYDETIEEDEEQREEKEDKGKNKDKQMKVKQEGTVAEENEEENEEGNDEEEFPPRDYTARRKSSAIPTMPTMIEETVEEIVEEIPHEQIKSEPPIITVSELPPRPTNASILPSKPMITKEMPTFDSSNDGDFHQPTHHISPRIHSSPLEQMHDQVKELSATSFSTGSSMMHARSFGSDLVTDEYIDDSSTEPSPVPSPHAQVQGQGQGQISQLSKVFGSKPLGLMDPKQEIVRKPSFSNKDIESPHSSSQGETPRPGKLERKPSIERRPSLRGIFGTIGDASPKANEEVRKLVDPAPLGENKRPMMERRPSLSEKIFGFEISPNNNKIAEDLKKDKKIIEEKDDTEKKLPPKSIDGLGVAKILMPELKDKLANNLFSNEKKDVPSSFNQTSTGDTNNITTIQQNLSIKDPISVTSRLQSNPGMELGQSIEESTSSLTVGDSSSVRHYNAGATTTSMESEIEFSEIDSSKAKLLLDDGSGSLKKQSSLYKTVFHPSDLSSDDHQKNSNNDGSGNNFNDDSSLNIQSKDSLSKTDHPVGKLPKSELGNESKSMDNSSNRPVGKLKLPDENHEPEEIPKKSKSNWKKPDSNGNNDTESTNSIAAAAARLAQAMAAKSEPVEPLKKMESKPIASTSTNPTLPVTIPTSKPKEEEVVDTGDDHLVIEVIGVIHPAHRLNRRVHIWNYSSGFSFDTIDDLHQFIYDIRESGDAPLMNLSYCTQDTFLDWSETMNSLREQEATVMADMYDDKVQLIINVTFMVAEERVTTQNYKINYSDNPADIAAKISSETGLDVKFLTSQINQEIVKENNFYQQGYIFLQNTMLFAEDLFLYQEEIIDRLSMQLEEMQQQLIQTEEAAQAAVKVAEENALKMAQYEEKNRIFEETKAHQNQTKEQWEKERDAFIALYQAEKSTLTNDLRLLRQSTNPNSEKVFADLRRNEVLLGSLEDQLVKSEMANDQLKLQLQIASERIDRLEFEKSMMEKHHLDQLAGIEGAGHHVAQFVQKTYYPIDGSSGESKETPSPTNRVQFFSQQQQQQETLPSNIKYYTPTTHTDKPIYNPKRSGGLSSYFGDLHPYLKFSSNPEDITRPRIPVSSRIGNLRGNMEFNWKPKNYGSSGHSGGIENSDRNRYQDFVNHDGHHGHDDGHDGHNNNSNNDDADQSTISGDSNQYHNNSRNNNHNHHYHHHQNGKISPSELNRMLTTRHLSGFVKNDNHPLRQALRQELPQISRIQKLQKEEEANKYRVTPYQVSRSGSGSSSNNNKEFSSDHYMGGTDSSNKKLREMPETKVEPRRTGVAWKV